VGGDRLQAAQGVPKARTIAGGGGVSRANREKRVVEAAIDIQYDGSEPVRITDTAN
jgi:hypothetical protein